MNAPRVVMDGAGVRLEFDGAGGNVYSFPLTAEAALELVVTLSGKLNELKQNPELQGKLGGAVAKTLFSWFTK